MKRFLAVVVLTCVLSVSVLAGEMPTMGGSAPVPSGAQSSVVVSLVLTIISLAR